MLKNMWHTFYMRSFFGVSLVSFSCSLGSMISFHEFRTHNNIKSYSFLDLNLFLLLNMAIILVFMLLYLFFRGKIKSKNYAEAEEVVRLRKILKNIDDAGLNASDIKSIAYYKNEIKRLSLDNAKFLDKEKRSKKRT